MDCFLLYYTSVGDYSTVVLGKPGYWVSVACRENSHIVAEVLITVHMVRM